MKILIDKLNNDYKPRNEQKKEEKKNVLESANKLFDVRKNIVNLFESRTFPYKGNVFKIKEEESKEESKEDLEEESKEESKEESNEERAKKIPEYIENETKDINMDLFNKYFNFAVPSALVK